MKANVNKMKLDNTIESMNLSSKLIEKMHANNIITIENIWTKTRKELKQLGFTDSEIKSVVIALQLEGLDLNKKKYD